MRAQLPALLSGHSARSAAVRCQQSSCLEDSLRSCTVLCWFGLMAYCAAAIARMSFCAAFTSIEWRSIAAVLSATLYYGIGGGALALEARRIPTRLSDH